MPGPMIEETPNTIAISLKILTLSRWGKISITIALPMTSPETAVAWRILKKKNISFEVEKIQPIDATIKTRRQVSNTGRLPYLSEKGPSKIWRKADATIKIETENCIIEKLVLK